MPRNKEKKGESVTSNETEAVGFLLKVQCAGGSIAISNKKGVSTFLDQTIGNWL